MGRRKATPTSGVKAKSRPATTPEARENQLIALAYDLVEQRLLDGTATSQDKLVWAKGSEEEEEEEGEGGDNGGGSNDNGGGGVLIDDGE